VFEGFGTERQLWHIRNINKIPKLITHSVTKIINIILRVFCILKRPSGLEYRKTSTVRCVFFNKQSFLHNLNSLFLKVLCWGKKQ